MPARRIRPSTRAIVLAGALLGGGVLLATSCTSDESGGPSPSGRTLLPGFGEVAATVRPAGTPAGGDRSVLETLCLLLASTGDQRRQGLMGVTDESLGGHEGMLFEFDGETSSGFWMRDTPMPLSIAFFGADGELVSTTDMEPCLDDSSCPLYRAAAPFRWAIEVPQGRLPDLGITEGASLDVGGECEPVEG